MPGIRKTTHLTALALAIAGASANAELRTETVTYEVDGQTFSGYMAWDDEDEGKRPGVLVVHEWWGHNAFAREQAEKLAAAGYTAFAWTCTVTASWLNTRIPPRNSCRKPPKT